MARQTLTRDGVPVALAALVNPKVVTVAPRLLLYVQELAQYCAVCIASRREGMAVPGWRRIKTRSERENYSSTNGFFNDLRKPLMCRGKRR
jgi:hypothetical protein